MQAIADQERRVTYVAPPAFGSMSDINPFDSRYYDRLGSSIADAVLPVLAHQQ